MDLKSDKEKLDIGLCVMIAAGIMLFATAAWLACVYECAAREP